jgi:flagellar M-ring protein FliF
VSVDPDIDFSQSKESLVKYGDSHVLSQDEAIRPQHSVGQPAIGIPGALSNRPPDTPIAAPIQQTPAATQSPITAPAPPFPVEKEEKREKPELAVPDTHRTTNYNIDRTVQFLEHPRWKLQAINLAVLINNPSGNPLPAERLRSVKTLVESAIGAGEHRRVKVIDLPFVEEGAAVGEANPPWWRQRWMTAVERNALMALAGLLVLVGGVLPLLRRIGAHTTAGQSPTLGGAHPHESGGGAILRRSEPALSPPAGPRKAIVIETETVRALVANDPARTAQVI